LLSYRVHLLIAWVSPHSKAISRAQLDTGYKKVTEALYSALFTDWHPLSIMKKMVRFALAIKGGTTMDILDIGKMRSTVRSYSERPLEQDKLDKILEAGRVGTD